MKIQNIKSTESRNIEGVKGRLKRERSNLMSVVELWADKKRKEEETNNKVFKRNKLLVRSPISGKEKGGVVNIV